MACPGEHLLAAQPYAAGEAARAARGGAGDVTMVDAAGRAPEAAPGAPPGVVREDGGFMLHLNPIIPSMTRRSAHDWMVNQAPAHLRHALTKTVVPQGGRVIRQDYTNLSMPEVDDLQRAYSAAGRVVAIDKATFANKRASEIVSILDRVPSVVLPVGGFADRARQ